MDLFGGTGNICLECISRGCEDVTYVDKYGAAVSFVIKMVKELKVEESIQIYKNDVFRFIKSNQKQYDFIFCDPPYALKKMDRLPDLIFEANMLAEDGVLVLEHDKQFNFEHHPHLDNIRNYGQTYFSFF